MYVALFALTIIAHIAFPETSLEFLLGGMMAGFALGFGVGAIAGIDLCLNGRRKK